MNVRIESSWQQRLQSEFDKPYFENLTAFVRHEYATKTVYPPGSQIFAAFDACPFDQVKVVILGQDPIMSLVKHMGFVFRLMIIFLFLLRFKIFSRRSRAI